MSRRRAEPAVLLRVDPVACDGVGMCAHLAAGVVTVDSWGYPIVPTHPLGRRARAAAAVAVAGCPRKALFLQTQPVPADQRAAAQRSR
jgi:ferredoxin